MNTKLSKNFFSKEFDSPDEEFSGNLMDPEFIIMLQKLRTSLEQPIIINSGYRTIAHNTAIKGQKKSAHLKGMAVDIHATDSNYRYKILQYAIACGFKRIGIGKNFIHLDIDKSKPMDIIWLY